MDAVLEVDGLLRKVGLMRQHSRRNVRKEIPFCTGLLVPVAELVERLP